MRIIGKGENSPSERKKVFKGAENPDSKSGKNREGQINGKPLKDKAAEILDRKIALKKVLPYAVLLMFSGILFSFYLDFVTFRDKLEGEKILYVKMDGATGTVLKVNNKYLKKQASIKNSKNLGYGFYLMRFDIKKVKEKNGFITFEGKIKGYKESGLNFLRQYILNIFDELFITEENLYAFSRATILGEKAEVSKDMNDKFKYTGLAHLVVISGSHISLIIIGIVKMLDTLNTGYRIKYASALLILTLYCVLIGLSPGILRAYIMGAMMILARLLFEQEDSRKSLIISFIIIVVLNPYSFFDISMQLSYAAVIAIVFVYPPFEKIADRKYFDRLKDGVVKRSLKLLLLSLVIQITGIPLFLFYFEKLPLFSFLLNIVGVPIGELLVEVLFVVTGLNILKIRLLNFVLVPVTEFIYRAFEGFIFMANKIPLLQVNINGGISMWMLLAYYILLTAVILLLKKNLKEKSEEGISKK